MTSYFRLNKFSLFILFILFLITACNNNGGDEKPTGDSSIKKPTDQINQSAEALIGGKLDTLWTDSLSFTKLDPLKVVLVFTFRRNDTLTLHGWSAEKDSIFKTPPDIRLIKGHADSSLRYRNNMYFGNVILKKGHVKHIKNLLDSKKAKFVLFAPQIIDGNHIGYKIFLSAENPASLVKEFAVIKTGVDANPSPPKRY